METKIKYLIILYSGTGHVEITKQSSTSLYMLGTLMWPANYIVSTYLGITLNSGESGIVLLTYNNGEDAINGTVNMDSLTYYKNSYLFFKGVKNQFFVSSQQR